MATVQQEMEFLVKNLKDLCCYYFSSFKLVVLFFSSCCYYFFIFIIFFIFVQELNSVDISGKFMVSFDVESLFTNIPLKESIDLAVSYIAEGNPNLKLSITELTKLFSIATSQTHFLFNGKVYDQVDGVAMGSPLAPVLANLVLGHHENIWLNKYQGPSVQLYRRYVDDTFCLLNTEQDGLSFFDFLNSQHPNIKFTIKKETNQMLSFLDVCVDNKDPSCLLT